MTSKSKRTNSTASSCPKCSIAVGKDDKGIFCDFCSCWFHAVCVNLSDAAYEIYAESSQLFFCPSCLPSGKRFFQLDKELSGLKKNFLNLEANINQKFEQLNESIKKLSENFKSLQKISCTTNIDNDSNKLIVSAVKDALEAESKKSTVVLENFLVKNDQKVVEEVRSFASAVGFQPEKIINIRQSGPIIKSRKTGADLPRIIKVKCDSETSKIELIKMVAKFADRGKRSKVYARPDRTWQERERLRQLNQELAEKLDTGDNDYYIDRNAYELKRKTHNFPRV